MTVSSTSGMAAALLADRRFGMDNICGYACVPYFTEQKIERFLKHTPRHACRLIAHVVHATVSFIAYMGHRARLFIRSVRIRSSL